MKQITLQAFERLENQRAYLMTGFRTYSEDQLVFKPGNDSWSIKQVLFHLVTAERESLKLIRRRMNRVNSLPAANLQARVRFLLLKIALTLPIKFKAPKVVDVQDSVPGFEEIVSEWDSLRSDFHKLLSQADETVFDKTIYRHPRAGYLTLKQTIGFMEDHIRHHLKQIERIRRHEHFPAGQK